MCGIVGYTGSRDAAGVLMDALRRLEYRGYDSAGIAVVSGGSLGLHKDAGSIADLERGRPRDGGLSGTTGIAHTRWATHGKPSKENAHPFTDCKGRIALAHNGIIENFAELRESLTSRGHRFTSETDTEVMVHLIEELRPRAASLEEAVRRMTAEVRGAYAVVVIESGGDAVVGLRKESPLLVGLGDGENLLSSDVPSLLKYTSRVVYLEDGDVAVLTPGGVVIRNLAGEVVERPPRKVEWSVEDAEKGGYEHFMLKEIHEQPRVLRDTLLNRLPGLELDGLGEQVPARIRIIGCGTSYHAGLVGKHFIETLAGVPATVELASEYRSSPMLSPGEAVVLISQSGESADTLLAGREARARGAQIIAVTNVVGSTVTRDADHVMYTRAGPEIGVAASKTFTAQAAALFLVGLAWGRTAGRLGPREIEEQILHLRQMPSVVQRVLDMGGPVKLTAEWISRSRDVFFIGRGPGYPLALEGALKLKEISYIHAEGYAAGELKHGPLALVTAQTPVVALAPRGRHYERMLGNIREVGARDGPVVAVGFDGDRELQRYSDVVLTVPEVPELFTPFPIGVLLQLFAYHAARSRGCPIDKPRNLAKSVTVE